MMLRQYQNNGFKTLVSNDYDQIIEQIIEYFRDVRILCSYCPRRFISSQSLENHIKSFHKCKVNVIDINNILNKLIVRLIPLESFELKEVRPKGLKEM